MSAAEAPIKVISSLFGQHPEDIARYPWLGNDVRFYAFGEKLSTEGMFGETWKGFASDADGIRLKDSPDLVVKVPVIDDTRLDEEITKRLGYILKKNREEFRLIRDRLRNCDYANTIIDVAFDESGENVIMPTVQLYLAEMTDLRRWLMTRFPERCRRSSDSEDRWEGIVDLNQIAEIMLQIVNAFAEIHRCRVVHGDIHPGNIFVSTEGPLRVKAIDFGEAFLTSPDFHWRPTGTHAYLAPERAAEARYLYEGVDAFSLGILMLFLTNGDFEEIRSTVVPPEMRRRDRWDHLEKTLLGNAATQLMRDEPKFMDIVLQCINPDPAERPRVVEILDDLRQLFLPRIGAEEKLKKIRQSLAKCVDTLQSLKHDEQGIATLTLAERQIKSLEQSLHCFKNDMVEIHGTRKQILRNIIAIVDELGPDDSWTSVTTLEIWQRQALGLSGSFMSAMIRALRRGVSFRRTYVVSVEELGAAFALSLGKKLTQSREPGLKALGKRVQRAFEGYKPNKDITDIEERAAFELQNRLQFLAVLDSLVSAETRFRWAEFCLDELVDISASKGLAIDMMVVPHLEDAEVIRANNPAVLIHTPGSEAQKEWQLLHAEIQGRARDLRELPPHLLSLRVWKSVHGYPRERINQFQRLWDENREEGNFCLVKNANGLHRLASQIQSSHDKRATELIKT